MKPTTFEYIILFFWNIEMKIISQNKKKFWKNVPNRKTYLFRKEKFGEKSCPEK